MANNKFDLDSYMKEEEAKLAEQPAMDNSSDTEGFDLDNYMSSQEQMATEADPKVSAMKAALLGAQQGATMGFGEELGAGIQSGLEAGQRQAYQYRDLLSKIGLDVPKPATIQAQELAQEGFTGDIGPTSPGGVYEQALEEGRQELREAEEEQPAAMMAGDIAGGMLAGGAAGKLAGGLAKARPIAASTAVGATEGLGRSEEEGLGVAQDVALGAALGGAGGLIGKKLGKVTQADEMAAEGAKKIDEAGMKALKTIGARAKDVEKELKTGKGIGKELLERGLIKTKGSTEELLGSIDSAIDSVRTKQMSPFINKLDEAMAEPSEAVQQKFMETFNDLNDKIQTDIRDKIKKRVMASPNADQIMERFDNINDRLMGEIMQNSDSMSGLLDVKRSIGRQLGDIDWIKDNSDMSVLKDYYKQMYGTIKDFTEDVSNELAPEAGKKLKDMNMSLSNLYDARRIAFKEAAREGAGSGLSLGDYLVSGVGASAGGLVGGTAAILGKKGIESKIGKSIPQAITASSARRNFQKGKKLIEKAEDLKAGKSNLFGVAKQKLSPSPTQTAAGLSGAVMSSTKSEEEIERGKTQNIQRSLSKQTPDELYTTSQAVREQYGEMGEDLANQLEEIAVSSPLKRTQKLFNLMQKPEYRKMVRGE